MHELQNERRCIKSEILCQRRHSNQFIVVMKKLYHVKCTKDRMKDTVFKAEWNVRGDNAMSTLYYWKSCTKYMWWVMMRECGTVLNAMKTYVREVCVKFAIWN